MEKTPLFNAENITKNYIFHYVDEINNQETYFCNCGNVLTKSIDEITIAKVDSEINEKIDQNDEKFAFESMFKDIKQSTGIICPKCQKDYDKDEIYNIIFPTDEYFLETFKFVETDIELTLYKISIKAVCDDQKECKLDCLKKYISFNKTDKRLKYYNEKNNTEYYFTLDKTIQTVKDFFNKDAEKISDDLIEIHYFVNRLANFVSDAKNFNLIDELLKEMIGKPGLDILIKTISIFLGIITYSNLSTIALTKGLNFLYDMMNNCNLPNPNVLSDNNATSPLSIFNFLVNLENQKAQEEIDSYNPNKQGYVFKAKSGNTHKILYNIDRFESDIEGKIHIGKEGVKVREDLVNKSVSKYIFKKITNFNEYKKLIKYTKFITYKELISLVMKYDTELLLNLFPLIEFRDDVSMERLYQFICLIKDYAKYIQAGGRAINLNKTHISIRMLDAIGIDQENGNQMIFKNQKERIQDKDIKYSLINSFDFTIYDDCLRMIQELNWDPYKEFYKIKDVTELEDYHGQLSKHFNMLADKEKNARFKNFVSKFKFLEEYDGDIKIKLIPTADALLKEAKELHNCASSYVNRISRNQYLLLTVYDNSVDEDKEKYKFMLGLHVTKTGLEFDQVKSKHNKQGSNKFKKQIMRYLEEKDISYRALADLKLTDKNAQYSIN